MIKFSLNDKQVDFIISEIETTYGLIDKSREVSINYLKIYITIVLALFGYVYFIEQRLVINNIRTSIPNDNYIIFGLYGIILTLIVFVLGWALLDNVTKAIYKSIKHYKHISHLRNMIASTFEEDKFRKASIIPLNVSRIPVTVSAQVPIIGAIINFGILLILGYFFSLIINYNDSLLLTSLFLCILSIFYSNMLEKHFEELLIAQKLRPEKNDFQIRKAVYQFVKFKKKSKNYVHTKCIYILLLSIVLLSIIIIKIVSLIIQLDLYWYYFPILLFIGSIIPRTYMGRHRIKDISCFK